MFSWCYSFFNCLGELISEAIWFGVLFMGRDLIKKMISLIEVILSSFLSIMRTSLKVIFPLWPRVMVAALKIPFWWASTFLIPNSYIGP